jgi:hypothetical protein
MFLTSDEVHDLTDRIQRAAQKKVLRSMGIEFRERPDGSVAVLRAHVEKLFGLSETKPKQKEYQPNWSAAGA